MDVMVYAEFETTELNDTKSVFPSDFDDYEKLWKTDWRQSV